MQLTQEDLEEVAVLFGTVKALKGAAGVGMAEEEMASAFDEHIQGVMGRLAKDLEGVEDPFLRQARILEVRAARAHPRTNPYRYLSAHLSIFLYSNVHTLNQPSHATVSLSPGLRPGKARAVRPLLPRVLRPRRAGLHRVRRRPAQAARGARGAVRGHDPRHARDARAVLGAHRRDAGTCVCACLCACVCMCLCV